MTSALVDSPRCLAVQATYVGPPRSLPAALTGEAAAAAWSQAVGWRGTTAYRAQAVKECLDTIAVLRSYREPMENETWVVPAASERRLLAQVNAIIALGPAALEQVLELSIDPELPDPNRVFAGLFVIGCVEGDAWLEQAADVFFTAVRRTPAEAAAAVEAFGLAPNPHLHGLLLPFLGDQTPRLRAAATGVLGYRGVLPEEDWHNALQDEDPAVIAAGLMAPLRGYDRGLCERTLQPLFARLDSEPLMRAALRAGVSLGLDAAHACALQIVQSDNPLWADAANSLAMFGYLSDVQYVRGLLEDGEHLPDGIRAAASFGGLELVPDLLELLHRPDLPGASAALGARALAIVTGLAPFAEVQDGPQALALWSRCQDRFHGGVRYRHGRPMTLDALLHALLTGPGQRGIRQNLYLEMLAATESRVPPFSPFDFVSVQGESLRRIEAWLASGGR